MKWISRYPWSITSTTVTVVHMGILYALTHYLYRRGISVDIDSAFGPKIATWHLYATGSAFFLGIIAIIRERPPYFALFAAFVGLFSWITYVG
jgi:uncharacterized membrane protein